MSIAGFARRAATIVGVAALYFASASAGLHFGAGDGQVSPFSPANGLAIALLFVWGRGLWPGVLLGSAIAHATSVSIPTALALGGISAGEAWITAWLLGYVIDRERPFQRVAEVIGFAILVSGTALLCSAATTGLLHVDGVAAGDHLGSLWRLRWISDAAGAIAIAPLLIVWSRLPRGGSARTRWHAAALVAATIGLTVLVFGGRMAGASRLYLLFPLVVWAALFGRIHGVVAVTAIVALIASWLTAGGHGPIAIAAVGDLFADLSLLDGFLVVFAITGLMLAAIDAQRRRAEREAAYLLEAGRAAYADADRSSRRTSEILDTITDAFLIIEHDWRVSYANGEAFRLAQLLPEVEIGSLLWDTLPQLVGTEFERRFRAAMETQQAAHFEARFEPLDAHFAVDLHPSSKRLLCYIRDVSEQRRIDEQRQHSQKMEVIGRLTGGISHDFNNLLQVVLGYGELASRRLTAGTGGVDVALEEMVEAANRAADLTGQLLTFGRRQSMNPEVLDLNEAVGAMDRLLRRLIGERVELATILAPEPVFVRVDRSQIEQVVVNLAVNGRDAMPDGGQLSILVGVADADEVRDGDSEPPARRAILTVSDTGVGMDPATIARVFEPFFSTKGERGTGLGLATVEGIITQSGGRIAVRSEPGRGTTFEIQLRTCEIGAVPEAPAIVRKAVGAETILLVEDEPAVREVVRRMLAQRGYRVLLAACGDAALSEFQTSGAHIDLLLTDVIMPGISGREMAMRFRELHPSAKVLFMSGYAEEPAIPPDSCGSGTPSIQKPFTGDDLARRVRDLMDEAAA